MRASLPTDLIRVHTTPISNVGTSVDSSVSIQDLFVPTRARWSYSVGVSRNRGGIHSKEQSGTGPPLTFEREDTVVGVGKIYPLKSNITIIIFRKGRLVLV